MHHFGSASYAGPQRWAGDDLSYRLPQARRYVEDRPSYTTVGMRSYPAEDFYYARTEPYRPYTYSDTIQMASRPVPRHGGYARTYEEVPASDYVYRPSYPRYVDESPFYGESRYVSRPRFVDAPPRFISSPRRAPPPRGYFDYPTRAPVYRDAAPPSAGRTRALLIGINYRGQGRDKELMGCANDARCLARFLDTQGWGSVVLMDESQRDRALHPTRDNIMRELRALVRGVQPGDSLFFGFSGHGSQIRDVSGDEADGKDEVLVTVDGKPIVDDDLFDILVRPLPAGVLLTAVTDCCHSGTVLDLPFVTGMSRRAKGAARRSVAGDVICFSGCLDAQESGDVSTAAGASGGACTNSLLRVLCEADGRLSYGDLLDRMRRSIRERRLTQTPVISATFDLDLDERFALLSSRAPLRPLPRGRPGALNPFADQSQQPGRPSGPPGVRSRGWFDSVLDTAQQEFGGGGGFGQVMSAFAQSGGGGGPSRDEQRQRAADAVKGDVRMFSGCKDTQTSADVSNVASFGLPTGPGGAGGACTNAMMSVFHRQGEDLSWVELLTSMREILEEKRYTQIPQLSSSRDLDLESRFEIAADSGGRRRALLVGINYVGQQGELRGCINDVLTMQEFLSARGFDDMRIMVDDPNVSSEDPTYANIVEGFRWLVEGAQPGDSLFFHYSGHGGQMRDDTGDERDGKDETLVPVDYRSAGQMRDDVIFKNLVLPVPDGCQLTVLMDCCHSGTILDLPFAYRADAQASESLHSGNPPSMAVNPKFDFDRIFQLLMNLFF
eukprot:TRINITY_DN8965_c0_g1_i1.p1 TRINITY_DN8965_c0_g1~~TRINITY_DN8965_c0_g1_i1.p1  ORF type:complete len:781 (+),score=151.26 TRINITY_DN8965_c0_g1_i1:53-2395(+)